eukprot:3632785-Alexandrium_andersonii.AAC.1
MAWVGHRLLLEEAVIVQENVPRFNLELLSRFFASTYYIDSCCIEASALGWATSRNRKWTVLRHKVKTLPARCPLNVFASLFLREREAGFTWPDYMRAAPEELETELQWACKRPGSMSSGNVPSVADPNAFRVALTQNEETANVRGRVWARQCVCGRA